MTPARDWRRPFRRARKLEGRLAACVLCFDRADYLEAVLASLARQSDTTNVDFLFVQDGAVHPLAGRRARDADVAACARLVERCFPDAELLRSPLNLGADLHTLRAEDLVFRERGYDQAVFFEDDLVVAPWYLSVLKVLLRRFERRERVAMLAAYGAEPTRALRRQHRRRRRLGVLGHHWGYAVYRDRWRRWQDEIPWYAGLLESHGGGSPRLVAEVRARYRAGGVRAIGSSQDAVKLYAMARCGHVKLNTLTNNARYIGARGVHFTDALFRRYGFDRSVAYDREWLHFDALDDTAIEALYRRMTEVLWIEDARSSDARSPALRSA